MVEIVGMTDEEIAFKKKVEELERIAEQQIPFRVSISSLSTGDFAVFDAFQNKRIFSAYPKTNKIRLDDKNSFELTHKIAEQYEQFTRESWTLKKDYNE